MGFSLSNALSGALGGAGAGSAFGPTGIAIGAGLGGLLGATKQNGANYGMSNEQKAYLQQQKDIASGKVESSEVKEMRSQANKNYAQAAGLMGTNRGASTGAKSAYLTNLLGQNQAQTTEAATVANARAREQANQNVLGMLNQQQALDIKAKEQEAANKANFMGKMAQLGAWGTSQYLKNNGDLTGQDAQEYASLFDDEGSLPNSAGFNPKSVMPFAQTLK